MPIATLIGFGWKGAFADAGVTIVQKAAPKNGSWSKPRIGGLSVSTPAGDLVASPTGTSHPGHDFVAGDSACVADVHPSKGLVIWSLLVPFCSEGLWLICL